MLAELFDEAGLLSAYGIRSHLGLAPRPSRSSSRSAGSPRSADYEPAESTSALFGGNSNWRGPIWLPLNALLVEALRDYDEFAPGGHRRVPDRFGQPAELAAAADDISDRLVSIFLPGPDGRRPVHGANDLLATDPRWRDNIPFHEYFHGDTGAGLGAEHQTGWTALVAHLLLTSPHRRTGTAHRCRGRRARPRAPLVQNVL